MPIYTRTGDRGTTALFNGKRVPKNNLRVETYGTIDELNSAIGVVVSAISNKRKAVRNIKTELEAIQSELLDIGSALANPGSKPLARLDERINDFEKLIDEMTEKMPYLKNFILPGGSEAGAMLHLCRTICRRAERHLVGLAHRETIDQNIIKYVNRLSDLLFTMARFVNHKQKKKETIWRKK